jgi:DNA repair exonuclease SbcCD ATPase subunit
VEFLRPAKERAMNEIRYGSVTIKLPDDVALSEEVTQLDQVAVSRILRAPAGLSQACYQAANSLEKAKEQFTAMEDISPETLRDEGQQIEKLEQVVRDLEVILSRAKRTSLLQKASTYTKLRRLNDMVKAYAKHDPIYSIIFKSVLDFFKKR